MQHGMDALSASLNADVRAVRQELEERASELEEASKSGSNTVEQDVRALEHIEAEAAVWSGGCETGAQRACDAVYAAAQLIFGLRKPASKQNLNSKPLSPMSRPQYASWRVVRRLERAER